MRKIAFGLVAALVSAGAVLAANQPPDSVRLAVQSRIDAAMLPDPADAAEAPHHKAAASMFRRVDVNDDGVTDWLVDFGKAPNGSYFCGTGGCAQQVYVSTPSGGYALAFDNTVRQLALRRAKGQMVLDVDYHGSMCGGFGVDPCPRSYSWSRSSQRFVERAAAGNDFLVGGPARPVALPEAALPAPVRAELARRQAACAAAGGSYPYESASVADVADLNGDQTRDWVVGGPYDGCSFASHEPDSPPRFPLVVFASGHGGFARVWENEETLWGLDLQGDRGIFVTLQGAEDCGLNGKDCRKIAWRWNGAALVSKAPEQP